MIEPQDLANGVRIELNDDVWTVVEFERVKPGKGGSFVRTKLKSIRTGRVLERTFKGTEKIPLAQIEYRKMQYVYRDGQDFVFMDMQTYEQITFTPELVGDNDNYLKEGNEIGVTWWRDKPAGLDMPMKVDLKVIDTFPGEKGNTVSQAMKPATLETGYVVQVPLFINVGDVVRVDTRDGKYEERVSS
ncbi:MAG: elongation factor P [Candidatus Sumerlaeota bacterium]|nr:elongation factor P [Candidatus Sumerlaeota bacterium]